MIVRETNGGVLLITQPDHAHLARMIMERSVPLADRPRRESILYAIGEHDNGWTEEDAAPTVDPATGGIVDFVSAPLSVRHEVWPRGVSRVSSDPWAAALVAQHAITVYDRFRPDRAWSSFFATMEAMRDERLAAIRRPLDELAADYVFVRLGDLISLTFCTGWNDEQRFGGWTVQSRATRVIVKPSLFGEAAIPIGIEGREVQPPFDSNSQLRAALSRSRLSTLHGSVSGETREAAHEPPTAGSGG
jgi:Protein of unknown function (DUF3891)